MSELTREMADLLESLCLGELSLSEANRLEAIVFANDELCQHYIRFMYMHALAERLEDADVEQESHLSKSLFSDSVVATDDVPAVPSLQVFGAPVHGTVGYFSSGWPAAYLVATVIFGIGLVVGTLIHVSQPVQLATQLPPVVKSQVSPERGMEPVGRVTAMVDCQWADETTATINGTVVPLGRKYALASGLMEITYDTGARVILQGPCTYDVESKDSGYLSVGKVTARLEKKAEGGGRRAEGSNPQPLIPNPSLSTLHPPLFTIKTPTATVVDLGTEFGVEVGRDGDTRTQVFVGSVRVTAAESGSETGQVLCAGQAAAVGAKNAQVAIVQIDPEDESPFVRVATPSKQPTQSKDSYADLVLSMNPAVYYRMERPTEEKNRNVLIDSAPGAHHGVVYMGDEFGLPYLSGRFGQSLGLRGLGRHGEIAGDYAIVPDCPQASANQLSFSAWVKSECRSETANIAAIAGIGTSYASKSQFRVFLFPTSMDLGAHVRQPDGSDATVREGETLPIPPASWQHVAFVADGSALRLYRNGEKVASSPCSGIQYDQPEACLAIGCLKGDPESMPVCFWAGRLDEVVVFHSALTPDQVRQLYLAKKLVSSATESVPFSSETPVRQR